jgi:hypothetical protein
MAKKDAAVASNVVDINKDKRVGRVLIAKVSRPYLLFSLDELGVEHNPEGSTEELVMAGAKAWDALPDTEVGSCDVCGGVSPANAPAIDGCCFCGSDEKGKVLAPPKKKAQKAPPAPKPSTEIVKAPPKKDDLVPASQVATERELDEAVAEVYRLKGDTAAANWDLGRKLREIHDRGLWQLRLGDDKKPRYKTWESFCNAEIKMSHTNVHMLMDVSAHFSREQIHALGTHKLGLLLQLPAAEQPRVMASIEAGATKAEVEAEVRKVKKETGFRRPDRAGTGNAKGRAGKTQKFDKDKPGGRKAERITIAAILGTRTLQAFKRPPSFRNFDPENPPPPAKRFADQACALEELENGVVQIITLVENASGYWAFKVERKRKSE